MDKYPSMHNGAADALGIDHPWPYTRFLLHDVLAGLPVSAPQVDHAHSLIDVSLVPIFCNVFCSTMKFYQRPLSMAGYLLRT